MVVISLLFYASMAFAGGGEDTPCNGTIQLVQKQGNGVHIGARVECLATGATAYTDDSGLVDLSELGAGSDDVIRISYISYESIELSLEACPSFLRIEL